MFATARAKSKESLRFQGESGSANFVSTVLGEVPDAAPPTASFEYGHCVWSSRSGTLPQANQVLLGDIFVAHHAKVKSKTGLGGSSVSLGGQTAPYAAIVSDDYDLRKNKIRVFEAARDSGKVDSAGYHLDAIKEGTLMVSGCLHGLSTY